MAPQPQAGGIVFHVAFDAQPVGLQPPDALAALHVDPPHGQRLAVETEILAGPGLAVIVAEGEEDGRHVEAAEAEHRPGALGPRSEEHTSELQSLMRISYAVFRLKKKNKQHN